MQDLLGDCEDEPEALIQESGARLHVLNYTGGMDPGAGVPWPESTCQSDMSDIVSAFDPGPEWPFPGLGDIMRFPDVLGAGSGKPSPGPMTC